MRHPPSRLRRSRETGPPRSTGGEPASPKPRCYRFVGPEFPPIPQACSLGPPLPGEFSVGFSPNVKAHATAATPARAVRAQLPSENLREFPAYLLRADIPAQGGKALAIPSNYDLPVYACSDGGTYCGSAVLRATPGSSVSSL